ncbi:Sulfite exporter TauE/SafE [Corynebacterium endometrii]|uniref:Probable membrane transporter protein n=2 Tax=Corynebacterium endometrii TaxID=2488819 RepID=A0A4P7QE53_9CORY|nr:sulfite exporter TauE/SafE family protein [Corynebacterium endometrii]QCB27855.1 Sulfite exporter TauE/SafE [Corynebacterium endometrii]
MRLPGSVAGAWAVASLSHRGLSVFIGIAVILAMMLSSFGWTPRYNKQNVAIASVASGFLGTSTAIGGPPLALVLKSQQASKMRGTLSATFVTASLVSIGMLMGSGQFNGEIWTVAAMYLPVVLGGLWAATKVSRHIDKARLNKLVVGVSIGAAIALIVKAIFGF